MYSRCFTSDAIWVPPGRPIARSSGEIRRAEEPTYDSNILELSITPFDVLPLSDSAISVLFDVAGRVISKELGAQREVRLTGMHIIETQSDGSWKISRQVWNSKP